MHVFFQKLAGEADVDGGLYFVARQDPDLDARLFELEDRVANIFLELILDRGSADELKINLNLLLGSHHSLLPHIFPVLLIAAQRQLRL